MGLLMERSIIVFLCTSINSVRSVILFENLMPYCFILLEMKGCSGYYVDCFVLLFGLERKNPEKQWKKKNSLGQRKIFNNYFRFLNNSSEDVSHYFLFSIS